MIKGSDKKYNPDLWRVTHTYSDLGPRREDPNNVASKPVKGNKSAKGHQIYIDETRERPKS